MTDRQEVIKFYHIYSYLYIKSDYQYSYVYMYVVVVVVVVVPNFCFELKLTILVERPAPKIKPARIIACPG
jgi:hypothetical protein